MASYKPILNNKPKRDGTFTIMIRITENRKHTYKALPYSIPQKDWNENGGKNGRCNYVRSSNIQYRLINSEIENFITNAKEAVSELEIKTPLSIKKVLKGQDPKSFIKFTEEHLERLKVKPGAFATYMKYKTILKKLKEHAGEDLMFQDIDINFLKNFEAHLYSIGNKPNTIHSNLKSIRAILYQASREDLIENGKNPFLKYKLRTERSMKERLTESEIKSIEGLKFEKDSTEFTSRNCWLFSFYCHGIRVADLIQLKFNNIQKDRLIYQMGKTGIIKNIKLIDKALKIIKIYKRKNSKGDDYIFPLLSNKIDYSDLVYLYNQISSKTAILNRDLKVIAKAAKIQKNLTMHLARHSFASIARDKTKDLSVLQKALGHSSLKITEAYLSTLSDESQDDFTDEVYK